MYDRSAKNTPNHTWSNLMTEPSIGEILSTIKKFPQISSRIGVDINLIKMLQKKRIVL